MSRSPKQGMSLQRRVLLVIMTTTLLALVLAAGAFFYYDRASYREKIVYDLGALADTMSPAMANNAIGYNDADLASRMLSALASRPTMQSAVVYDREGQVFAQWSRSGAATDRPDNAPANGHAFHEGHLVVRRDMTFNERPVGILLLRSDLAELEQRLADYSQILVLIVAGVAGVALLLSLVFARALAQPIRRLAQTARKVTEGKDYTVRATKQSNDEIGRLTDDFNDMLAQIQVRDEELQVARDHAEMANRSKSVFLANMSHELRTPLTAIIGYSEILEDDAGSMGLDDFLPDLQKIKAAGKHLLGLINSILDLSKVEAGKMELFLEEYEVAKLIEEVATTVKPLVEKNGNRLVLKVQDDLPKTRNDLTKTRQILFNLLSNASKFTDGGRISLDVQRSEAFGSDWLVVQVADTGIGMTEDQVKKLFKPFTQADASTARHYGGTGLGLALCKRFSELMGGWIDVESKPGTGTTFTVYLPFEIDEDTRQPKSLKQRIDTGEWRRVVRRHSEEQTADVAAKTVLVIDDDPSVHELLASMLRADGYRIEMARDGQEGLTKARTLQPDIITLDVYMPGQDGWSVLSQIQADPELSKIPVIMISVSDERKKGYALGADFLAKPIDRDKLRALVEKYGADGQRTGLVVDDDPDQRTILRKVLEELGWDVLEAENGIAALRRVAEKEPDLVFLDLIMPQLDGFGFLSQLRRNAAWRDIPVVVLTAMDLGPEERERLNGGVERILQKSAFSLEELRDEIQSLTKASLRT